MWLPPRAERYALAGDVVLSGTHYGRVKAMFNERNQKVEKAGPSEPVLILGLDGAPTAGETFNVMETEQEARSIASKREQLKREQDNRTKKGLTLDELARRRALGNFQELNVIIKGDVDGSIEALSDSLIRLSTEEIQVNVIHKGVGQISESDVVPASASSAIILGFQVRPSQAARRLADREGVEIRTYSIIYDTIEDIKSAMEGDAFARNQGECRGQPRGPADLQDHQGRYHRRLYGRRREDQAQQQDPPHPRWYRQVPG